MFRHRIIIWFLLSGAVLGLTSCSERKLHEAQAVVAAADSLRAEGQTYTDSLSLAEAYRTLSNRSRFYPDDYAHACYHYGRLLREKDNPVEAMQVFINATHSRSRDYHILGRIYSNMGSLCHLAGEYDLSYDMYEHSANMFLSSGDTLLYYYLLNDMAVEYAVQGKEEETLSIISTIQHYCLDSDLLIQTYATEAEMYFQKQCYDSAVFYTSKVLQYNPLSTPALLVRAQSYSFLHMGDSAVHYAELLLNNTNEIYDKNNALYILTNDDETKDKQSIRETAAARSDTQKEIENKKARLSKAVQLLEQDIQRKPDITWIIAVIGTLICVAIGICIYIVRKRQQKRLLSQQVESLEYQAQNAADNIMLQVEANCRAFSTSSNFKEGLYWRDYDKMCEVLNQQFFHFVTKLQAFDEMHERDIRLCILVLLNLNHARIAELMYVESSSVGKLKERTAKKLKTSRKNLRQTLLNIIISGDLSETK